MGEVINAKNRFINTSFPGPDASGVDLDFWVYAVQRNIGISQRDLEEGDDLTDLEERYQFYLMNERKRPTTLIND